ncbi:MAG: TonB-dependent receptor [Rhodanobacter sp.]
MSFRKNIGPHRRTTAPVLRITAALIALGLGLPLYAQQAPTNSNKPNKSSATTLDNVQVIGSRAKARTAAESVAPVDVLSGEQLRNSGVTEVGQALQLLEPSFNFSQTFVSDGEDAVRPATLRGLDPDQVLVLVNGKRRHQQALVNVQQDVGRGSSGTDINAIPIAAVERIEVLRDGAAAQYGSDAIAGVINIVLKKQVGTTYVSLDSGKTYAGDGLVRHGSVNTGVALGKDGGYLNMTAEYSKRGATDRASPNTLMDPPRTVLRVGDAKVTNAYFWLNGGLPVGPGELYWFGGVSKRDSNSGGFFRGSPDNRTIPELYPNGFLPLISTTIKDASLAVGYRTALGGNWKGDVSLSRGRNQIRFGESHSANVTWWYEPKPSGGIYADSPTSANTGTLALNETSFNLDVHGPIDWGIGNDVLNVATGFEWRKDSYNITAGDPVSYTYGRTDDRSIPIYGPLGQIAQPGIQGFPGWSPAQAVDSGRHNWSMYGEVDSQFTDRLFVGAAARFEKYSDSGNTTTGKLSARFDATDTFAIRGTIATGFRAPGVQQEFYSQRSTNLSPSGVLVDTLTARSNSDVTRAFGIQPLKPETSRSGSLGFVYNPGNSFTATIDVFKIDIDDRIIFSSNIVPETTGIDGLACSASNANCPIAAILQPFGVGQVIFFTNAIDTSTKGVDVVMTKGFPFADSNLDLTAAFNYNKTTVTKRKSQSAILPPDALFDDTQVRLVEDGKPHVRGTLQGTYRTGAWDWVLRENYYGPVSGDGYTPGKVMTWSGKTLTDVSVGYRFSHSIQLTVGANNVFNTYPDKWDPQTGAPFPQMGFKYGWETLPFGINGGYYYARLDIKI